MNKSIFFAGLVLLIMLVSGCDNIPGGCTEEAKICPDGSAVGRTGLKCEFAPCPKTYACQQDSDCVVGIRIDSCCSCPSAYPKSQLEDDKNIVIYEYGKDYSSLIKSNEDCRKVACKPCLFPGDADIKCVYGQCKMMQRTEEFKQIDQCIITVQEVYSSGKSISNSDDAIMLFNEFLEWSKTNATSRLWDEADSTKTVNAQDAEPHGIYNGAKYWTVTYSYYAESSQVEGRTQMDIREDGDVVIFLGCA